MEISFLEYWWLELSHVLSRYFFFAGSMFFIFYVLLRNPMWYRKVQKTLPKLNDYGRDIIFSLISVSIFASVALVVFYFLNDHTRVYRDFEEYSVGYYIFSWFWMLFIHDTYFYWMHRMMHHPTLFKYVHLVHHKSTNPSPWTAYAFHPLEAFLEALIVPVIAFSFPVHGPAIGLFFLFQIVYNVYGHLGFELYPKGFHKNIVGRWVNTSVAHNLHHKKFNGNFGLYFLFWDRMMGTLRSDYDDTYKATTENRDL